MVLLMACFYMLNESRSQVPSEKSIGYGLRVGLNYSLSGLSYTNYSGSTGLTGGLFISKPVFDHFALLVEPGYTGISFREQSSDKRYNAHYLEAGFTLVFYPSALSREFAFQLGYRPSLLAAYNSEFIEYGNYVPKTFENNKNKIGGLDGVLHGSISIAMSDFVNLELGCNYSLSNKTTATEVKGRPSTIETGLRLNAVSLKEKMTKKEKSLRDVIAGYSKGSLFVMLATPNNKELKKLEEQGKIEEMKLINTEILARNQKIMRDFKENYSISKVYFFMDTSAYKLISGSYRGIFVDVNLKADENIQPDTNNYFVAAFTEDISTYTNKMHFGLFLYDEKMNPLGKPFSHPGNLVAPVLDGDPINYLRKRANSLGVPYGRVIGKFNTRLFKYLN